MIRTLLALLLAIFLAAAPVGCASDADAKLAAAQDTIAQAQGQLHELRRLLALAIQRHDTLKEIEYRKREIYRAEIEWYRRRIAELEGK